MSDRTEIDVIKSRVNILELLAMVGARMTLPKSWDDEVSVFCPYCPDATSKKPAGRANAMKGVYFCYACGFGGDVISIAKESMNLEFDEALAWLDRKFPATETENPWK